MAEPQTLPLSRVELAVAEAGEILAKGLEPGEIAERGWENLAGLMAQRRRLILEDEIAAAPSSYTLLD
jgi:hypothetical protein